MKPFWFTPVFLAAILAIVTVPGRAQETGCCQPTILRAPIVLDSSPASARIQPWPVTTARFEAPESYAGQVSLPAGIPNTSRLVLPPPPTTPATPPAVIYRGQMTPDARVMPVTSYRPVTTSPAVPSYRIGTGIFGQPKLYVPNQPIRNFLRSLSL